MSDKIKHLIQHPNFLSNLRLPHITYTTRIDNNNLRHFEWIGFDNRVTIYTMYSQENM